ncbi:unnamed protein product [Gongylonema pulchrum]|uniref:Ricin B-type lectin domain-containing protein n=1 Tax=Gongylonema pulchrum TaxID=637853 RepID=A0A183D7I7_9BILA|nr:unnamed protein product [Gongylonema pulchrum]
MRTVDEDIICTLYTLDQVMSLCANRSARAPFTLVDCLDGAASQNFDWHSADLQVMSNCFCMRTLLRNATERELLLLPTLSFR